MEFKVLFGVSDGIQDITRRSGYKSETFEKFKQFQSEVENHRNKKIKFYGLIVGENI